MTATRYLIVNADDFGQSEGVNRGVIQSHEQGIVTSASLMVRCNAAVKAADYARTHPRLSLGLHVDLGEWDYRDGEWVPVYRVVSLDDRAAVTKEITRQLTGFVKLTGRRPTHLDSHQHVHLKEPARQIITAIGRDLGIPVRSLDSTVRYCGDFYGATTEGSPFPDGISVQRMLAILRSLPVGFTELGCHPGLGSHLPGAYSKERRQEAAVLCDPLIRLETANCGVELRSFSQLRG